MKRTGFSTYSPTFSCTNIAIRAAILLAEVPIAGAGVVGDDASVTG